MSVCGMLTDLLQVKSTADQGDFGGQDDLGDFPAFDEWSDDGDSKPPGASAEKVSIFYVYATHRSLSLLCQSVAESSPDEDEAPEPVKASPQIVGSALSNANNP